MDLFNPSSSNTTTATFSGAFNYCHCRGDADHNDHTLRSHCTLHPNDDFAIIIHLSSPLPSSASASSPANTATAIITATNAADHHDFITNFSATTRFLALPFSIV
jgi:hypothetical protein